MSLWRLANPEEFPVAALASSHNHALCAGGILLAILASSVLLPVTQRYHYGDPHNKYWWLVAGSIAMGFGIWAMHFTSMLALQLPINVEYNLPITILSVLPAIVASAGCIHLFQTKTFSRKVCFLSAAILASGIGIMHYLGMEAIIVSADMYYTPKIFLLSLLSAYILTLLSLYIYRRLTTTKINNSKTLGLSIGSILLGLAVSATHFIAMSATFFQPTRNETVDHLIIAPYGMVFSIVGSALLLIIMIVVGIRFDRKMGMVSKQLHESEMRFQSLADSTKAAIFLVVNDRIIYANPTLSQISGYAEKLIPELPIQKILGNDIADFIKDFIRQSTIQKEIHYREFEVVSAKGERCWLYINLSYGEINGEICCQCIGLDISEQKKIESELNRLAYTDQLTGIGNRAKFIGRLDHHLKLLSRRAGGVDSCVILLDLNGFKQINDTHGHQQGDLLLKHVALRLLNIARGGDTIARLGGDEFVLLFEEISSRNNLEIIVNRVISELEKPITLDHRTIKLRVSLGVLELRPSTYTNCDDVLRDVDIAMYRAKETPNVNWVLYDNVLSLNAKRVRQLQIELKEAILNNRLELYYQPIIDVEHEQIVGFEALSRWQRKNNEWVSPAEFIPLAESMGIVTEIGNWSLKTAVSQLRIWQKEFNHPSLYVSVNIATVSFSDDRFYDYIKTIIKENHISTGTLKLEITESMLIQNIDLMNERLNKLRKFGCEFMIDDFGTGYSSLSYLHKLPVSTVKIDKSFVQDLDVNDYSSTIINSIITLATNLKMSIIAEGIETESQKQYLLKMGCKYMQGYLYAKPLPAKEINIKPSKIS